MDNLGDEDANSAEIQEEKTRINDLIEKFKS
jgi:hypothetical protein